MPQQLNAALNQLPFTEPGLVEVGAYFLQHIRELSALLANETLALLQARQLGKYYARKLAARDAWVNALHQCNDLNTLEELVRHYYR